MRPRVAYGFGIVGVVDASSSRGLLVELTGLLSSATGILFFPHHAVGYRQLGESLERGDVGLAWMPPIPAVDLEDHGTARVIALPVRRGMSSYQSAFIVARGGPKSLQELSNARVGWVDKESTAGYLVPRMHLIGAGIDLEKAIASEIFLHGHDRLVEAVVSGRVDLGATFCIVDPRTQRVIQGGWTDPDGTNAKPVEVIAMVGPIPNDAIVASTKLAEDAHAKALQWLLNPQPRAKEIFSALLRADAFRASSPAHFDPLRRTLRAARARGEGPASVRG